MHEQLWGYKVEEELHEGGGGTRTKKLNSTALIVVPSY
jgi:hypothetical protein